MKYSVNNTVLACISGHKWGGGGWEMGKTRLKIKSHPLSPSKK